MPNYNPDILIRNIRMLMKDNNNMTQEQLGDVLGMSQSNVSKALSVNNKKSFTLDQIAGIAKHFGVSFDWLVGNTAAASKAISPRSVALMLSTLIEKGDMEYKKFNKTEVVYEPFAIRELPYLDYDITEKEVEYFVLHIPGYWKVPKKPQCEDDYMDIQVAQQAGNDTRLNVVNDFLRKFIQIFEVYKNKGIDEEAYRTVVENYLSRLRDN